ALLSNARVDPRLVPPREQVEARRLGFALFCRAGGGVGNGAIGPRDEYVGESLERVCSFRLRTAQHDRPPIVDRTRDLDVTGHADLGLPADDALDVVVAD